MTELKEKFLKELENGKNGNFNLFVKEDLYDLISWGDSNGFIDGIAFGRPSLNGNRSLNLNSPRVTMKGKEYLESLKNPQIESLLKVEVISPDLENISINLQGLNKGQQEMIKLFAEHIEILGEIKFLSADKVTIMKEELVRLRNSDNEKNIPWDTLINLTSLIASVTSKVS